MLLHHASARMMLKVLRWWEPLLYLGMMLCEKYGQQADFLHDVVMVMKTAESKQAAGIQSKSSRIRKRRDGLELTVLPRSCSVPGFADTIVRSNELFCTASRYRTRWFGEVMRVLGNHAQLRNRLRCSWNGRKIIHRIVVSAQATSVCSRRSMPVVE